MEFDTAALTDGDSGMDLVTGSEAVVREFIRLRHSAVEEIAIFDRPPYVAMPEECEEAEMFSVAQGVKARTIYEHRALENPAKLALFQKDYAKAEESRVLPELPMKLAIADHKLALVPLDSEKPERGTLVVHASPLLDGLLNLFEMEWRIAVPFRLTAHNEETLSENVEITDEDRLLLGLLSAGLKDQAIARQLGLGVRTLHRRIARVMDILGASTRFQAGLQAARRDWL